MGHVINDTSNLVSSSEDIDIMYNMSVNTSGNEDSCTTQYLVDNLAIKLLFVLLYFIIFCLGFFGNILGKNQKVLQYIHHYP